jgi:hypothetical protein
VVLVAVPAVLCCCGGAVTVPVAWFVRGTVAAGKGQPSPDAAASAYLLTLSAGDESGLLPLLVDGQEDVLLAQWRAYRADMARTDPGPSKLEHTLGEVVPDGEGHALVAAEVYPVWWPAGGGSTSMHGSRHGWQLAVRDDGGWRVESVTPYPWCGGYVRADACR